MFSQPMVTKECTCIYIYENTDLKKKIYNKKWLPVQEQWRLQFRLPWPSNMPQRDRDSHNTGGDARSGNSVRCRVDKPQNKQMKSN